MALDVVTTKTSLKFNSCFILVECDLDGNTKKIKELNIRTVFKAARRTQDSVNSVTDSLDSNIGPNGVKILTGTSGGNENNQDPICTRSRT